MEKNFKFFSIIAQYVQDIALFVVFGVEGVTLVVSEQVKLFSQCVVCLLCFQAYSGCFVFVLAIFCVFLTIPQVLVLRISWLVGMTVP